MIRTSFVKKGCYAYLFTANYIEMKIGKSKDLGNPDLLHAIVFLFVYMLKWPFYRTRRIVMHKQTTREDVPY